MNSDEHYMARCLELAQRGRGLVAPNPMVGCVIVHKDTIIGEGFHESFGAPHAEADALSRVSGSEILSASSLYVNLEPCAHTGNTPPCCDLIVNHRINRVVIGMRDPNPAVEGGGIEKLKDAGVDVVVGVEEHRCRELNRRFEIYCLHQRPYIILKWAQTADGYVAREDGSSKWISSPDSRNLVHRWRSEEAGILVGTRTAEIDNPRLTSRLHEFEEQSTGGDTPNPLRIVLDRTGALSPSLHLFDGEANTLLITENADARFANTEVVSISFDNELLTNLLSILYQRKILSLFVEGGSLTLQKFIDQGLWDEARVFENPRTFGSGIAAPKLADANAVESSKIAEDTLTIYRRGA